MSLPGPKSTQVCVTAWWRHQMETFSALLAICAGNSPVPGEFPTQRPVTRSFDFFFDLPLNNRLSKQSWGWWFETLSGPLWRHSNGMASLNCNDLINTSTIYLAISPHVPIHSMFHNLQHRKLHFMPIAISCQCLSWNNMQAPMSPGLLMTQRGAKMFCGVHCDMTSLKNWY